MVNLGIDTPNRGNERAVYIEIDTVAFDAVLHQIYHSRSKEAAIFTIFRGGIIKRAGAD